MSILGQIFQAQNDFARRSCPTCHRLLRSDPKIIFVPARLASLLQDELEVTGAPGIIRTENNELSTLLGMEVRLTFGPNFFCK